MCTICEYCGTSSVTPRAGPGVETAGTPDGSRDAIAPTNATDGGVDEAPARRISRTWSW